MIANCGTSRRQLRMSLYGFTIIELLISVVVAAILVAIAVPDMRIFLDNQAIRSACSELADSLALGRAEAIRRGSASSQLVVVGPACSSTLGSGWAVYVDSNGDSCHSSADQIIQRSSPPSRGVTITAALTSGSTSTTNSWVGFNGQGMTREPAGNFIAGTFTCSVAGSAATNAVLTINSLGRVRQAGT